MFCPWRFRIRTSAYGIAMAIPRAEVWNSELQMLNPVFCPFSAIWRLKFRIPVHGIAMAIHGQKFGIGISEQGLPSVCEFSAFRHFFKTNVAQSVAELVLYTQKTRNVVIFYQIW